ncbi:hypothetical protein ASU33_17045 [Solirubrum puertoriconensis]|uniref:Uncharacterized protein n=1 Tax=Solirubrum puertoriconensis TaxID=1751427 RepID=A0A9X0HNW7_SOLP1|nr:hypothetical protein ASU33_17045 [Solirubrum puertoriconensis]
MLWILLFTSVLWGCDGQWGWLQPYPFENAPAQRPLNLAHVLGRQLTLTSATDTLELLIRFERSSRTSVVLDATTGDTLLSGWVTRYRGLYYFAEPRADSTYWVHAWRIKGNHVQGLMEHWAQMLALRDAVEHGRFAELKRGSVTDTVVRLHYDAPKLHAFYEAAWIAAACTA